MSVVAMAMTTSFFPLEAKGKEVQRKEVMPWNSCHRLETKSIFQKGVVMGSLRL
jgi:hypothetical protein